MQDFLLHKSAVSFVEEFTEVIWRLCETAHFLDNFCEQGSYSGWKLNVTVVNGLHIVLVIFPYILFYFILFLGLTCQSLKCFIVVSV